MPKLADLVAMLNPEARPKQLEDILLVASCNIRASGYTDEWCSEAGDSPRRDLFHLRCIAEISRFDVMAVEGARGTRRLGFDRFASGSKAAG